MSSSSSAITMCWDRLGATCDISTDVRKTQCAKRYGAQSAPLQPLIESHKKQSGGGEMITTENSSRAAQKTSSDATPAPTEPDATP